MIKQNRRAARLVTVACLVACGVAHAAAPAQTPFKLGTFRAADREFTGLVLRDSVVLDIAAANAQYERSHAGQPKVLVPADMKQLIERYDSTLGPRLRALANEYTATQSAPFIHKVEALKVLPPVRPSIILNAGANYPEHAAGIVAEGARAAAQAAPAGAAAPPGAGRPPGAGAAPGAGGPPARPRNPRLASGNARPVMRAPRIRTCS